jgi:hypothetical protein
LTVHELSSKELEPSEQLRSQIRVKIEQARRAIQVQKAKAPEPSATTPAPAEGGLIVQSNDARLKRPRFCS